MGAVAAKRGIYDAITDAGPTQGIECAHGGHTYSAHPASCSAGLAMMDLFAKERLIDRAAAMSPKFIDAILSLRDCAMVTDIRSVGMMAAVDVAVDGTAGARGHEAQERQYDAGLNLKGTGDARIVAPPLVVGDKHLDEFVSKLRGVLKEL